jgi:rRNA maturation RNase YbeY
LFKTTNEASEISVVLTDDAQMKALNRLFLQKAETTDVLSFRYDSLPGEQGADSGEIMVNVEQAVREGLHRAQSGQFRNPWSPSHELCLYLAHGCDHLGGWDDQDPAGRRRMRRRELRWVRMADSEGLVQYLVNPERPDRELTS